MAVARWLGLYTAPHPPHRCRNPHLHALRQLAVGGYQRLLRLNLGYDGLLGFQRGQGDAQLFVRIRILKIQGLPGL